MSLREYERKRWKERTGRGFEEYAIKSVHSVRGHGTAFSCRSHYDVITKNRRGEKRERKKEREGRKGTTKKESSEIELRVQ